MTRTRTLIPVALARFLPATLGADHKARVPSETHLTSTTVFIQPQTLLQKI